MPLTIVASATSATAGVSYNQDRNFLIVENSDANRVYVLLGEGTVSATNYSFSLAENENAGFPSRDKVSLLWAGNGSGSAYITEVE
jgi:hypothetical protein